MKQSWIIEIRVDDVITGRVGPFDAECVADMYCDAYLRPAMPAANFHIVELTDPGEMCNQLTAHLQTSSRS